MNAKALFLTLPAIFALAACTDSGHLKVPFEKERPFVASPVPADFAVVVDENHDTFYSRQHIMQSISVADAMSTTTYTTFRDLNNTVSNHFSQETPLKPEQLQSMWNAVSRYNLMNRSTPWINWYSGADLYKHNSTTIQIRANGQTAVYRQSNGYAGAVRPLMLQVQAVRLPLSQDANTPVITPREEAPQEAEPTTLPSSSTTPTTIPDLPLTPETLPAIPVLPKIPATPTEPPTRAITPMEAPAATSPAPHFTPDNIKNGSLPR